MAASVTGTSHDKTLAPCQDAHAYALVAGVAGSAGSAGSARTDAAADPTTDGVVVLVAADGAGSASRSEVGSRLACDALLADIQSYLAAGGTVATLDRETALAWMESAASAVAVAAAAESLPPRDFACTLLAAVVSPTHAAYVQVGDGAIVIRSSADAWEYVFWPQHGEYINTTVFLTDPTAVQNFHFTVVEDVVNEVAVFTDGIEALVLHYATQTVHGPFFDGVFPAVRALPDAGFGETLSQQLASYLASPAICGRTDDDKTLLLASRLKRPPSRALVLADD